jgi:hypothetical protein
MVTVLSWMESRRVQERLHRRRSVDQSANAEKRGGRQFKARFKAVTDHRSPKPAGNKEPQGIQSFEFTTGYSLKPCRLRLLCRLLTLVTNDTNTTPQTHAQLERNVYNSHNTKPLFKQKIQMEVKVR